MRTAGWCLIGLWSLTLSCGGGDGIADDREVASLADDEARDLCAEFFDAVCSGLPDIDACLEGCDDLCARAETPATLRSECPSPIEVGAVRECAEAVATEGEGAYEVCTGNGAGGCVFDVADLLCPGR